MLTGTGIWSRALRYGDHAEAADAAAELEALGYGAFWVPDTGGDLFGAVGNLLAATRQTPVATGILNIWMHTAAEAARQFDELTTEHGHRLLLGIGVSHARLVDRVEQPGTYRRPVAHIEAFLDDLDAADPPVPSDDRLIAALGPRMLDVARRRAAGTHLYLVTPEHTAATRATLGGASVVAVEQGWCWRQIAATPTPSPASTWPPTSTCPTTRTTGSAAGSPTTTSSPVAATGSSTPSSHGETTQRSPAASTPTALPARATCACRSSP